jgi:hypothetical protein
MHVRIFSISFYHLSPSIKSVEVYTILVSFFNFNF